MISVIHYNKQIPHVHTYNVVTDNGQKYYKEHDAVTYFVNKVDSRLYFVHISFVKAEFSRNKFISKTICLISKFFLF